MLLHPSGSPFNLSCPISGSSLPWTPRGSHWHFVVQIHSPVEPPSYSWPRARAQVYSLWRFPCFLEPRMLAWRGPAGGQELNRHLCVPRTLLLAEPLKGLGVGVLRPSVWPRLLPPPAGPHLSQSNSTPDSIFLHQTQATPGDSSQLLFHPR